MTARKIVLWIFWKLGALLEYLNRTASLVGSPAFLDPGLFAWTRNLEAAWPSIRAELDALLVDRNAIPNLHDISEEHRSLSDDDRWKIFALVIAGTRIERNCARCPATMNALAGVTGLCTAVFSILGPGKHIREHRGYYNGVLRYHLGLLVPGPAGACRIRVGGKTGYWAEGRSMIFDDTYPHEVWNDAVQDRVVLYLDVLRPVRFPMSAVNRAFIAIFARPFVREGQRKIREWADLAGKPGA